jgi:hypothetical protein
MSCLHFFRFSSNNYIYLPIYFSKRALENKKHWVSFTTQRNNSEMQDYLYFKFLFSHTVTSKKHILLEVAAKKKTNLFKKFDNYKRSYFYEMYNITKSRHYDVLKVMP